MDFFENLLNRDLNYPHYMDWSVLSDKNNTTFYQHPFNKNRVVMVSKTFLNESLGKDKMITHTAITYYYGSKIHRLDGPSQISFSEFSDRNYTTYEISWSNRGLKSRKGDGPAIYSFRKDESNNIKLKSLKWGCIVKKGNFKTSLYHKLNGPAVISKDESYTFYIDGIALKENRYWKTMLLYYPQHMPKIISEDNVKITFEYKENKPAPHILYKNINKTIYILKNDNENNVTFTIVDGETYWKKTYEKLAIKNNWLITE